MVEATLNPAKAKVKKTEPDAAAVLREANEPWQQARIVTAGRQGVRFLWQPGFLERAFHQTHTRRRGADKSDPGGIILADIFVMDEDKFAIEGKLLVTGHNRFRLHLNLLGSPNGDARPRVVLKWGTQERSAVFRNGVATIENLPPMHPKPPRPNDPVPEFSLTIVFDGKDGSAK